MKTLYPADAYRSYYPQLKSALQAQPKLLFAILYGSAAEGAPFHDLDIALYVDRAKVPVSQDWDLTCQIAVVLADLLPFPVDVRIINEAPLLFRYNVSKGTPLIVKDQEAYFQFLEQTWDRYLDFKPVAMQYIREMA